MQNPEIEAEEKQNNRGHFLPYLHVFIAGTLLQNLLIVLSFPAAPPLNT
jgi:hypothetical protein